MSEVEIGVEPTGIEELDTVLGGGIPQGSVVLLLGMPGTGKTILSAQLCFSWLRRASARVTEAAQTLSAPTSQPKTEQVLFFTIFSEPHDKVIKHLGSFNFFDKDLLSTQIKLLSLSNTVKDGFQKVGDTIIQTVIQEKARLIVLDSLGSLENGQPEELKQFLYRLSGQLNVLKATVIISLARAYQSSVVEGDLTFADGIIGLSNHTEGVHKIRRVEILKMRGIHHILGSHHYAITDDGLRFYPRLETWYGRELNFAASNHRLGFGLPELDQVLGGGIFPYSSSLIAGSIGTGKTLTTLYYLLEGVQRGEKGLYVGFYESSEQLMNKAAKLGLDLRGAVENGQIILLTLSSVELEPDWLAWLVREQVSKHSISRLVVDGFEVVERACRREERSHEFVTAFVNYFKAQGVTAIYTHDIGKLIGTELDLSYTPFTALTENMLLLRQVEYNNRLYRIMAVLKMRDSDYDPSIRLFTIEDGVGLKVLQPFESAENLLSGLARSLGKGTSSPQELDQQK